MKLLKLLVFLSLISQFSLNAQVKKTYTYAVKNGQELKLDVYSPDAIENNRLYPTLLWIHGGGFSGGSRDYKDDVNLCNAMAQKGYIAISISYRLLRKDTSTGFGCDCPKQDKLETFKQAISDYYDAALYVVNHHEELLVDPNYMIAGGSSAGAETVLNAVYLKEYFLDDLNTYESIDFAGVWSLAGAVVDADYITQKNAIPTVLFHGTSDPLVPFGTAPHHYCQSNQAGYLMLDGSETIAENLQQLQKPFYFYIVKNAGHEIASIPTDGRLDAVLQFFNTTILNNENLQIRKIIETQ